MTLMPEIGSIGKIIIVFMCVHYFRFIISLFFKKSREGIKYVNQELELLRHKTNKTLEEQKRFIELKYPKKEPFKWKKSFHWKSILKFLWTTINYMAVLIFFFWLFRNLVIPLWMALIIIFVVPHIISWALRKFGVQDHNIIVDLVGGSK